MNRIFVYGTLKQGQPNYSLFSTIQGQRNFLGYGVAQKKFPLVIAGSWNLPCLLHIEDKGKNVKGEIYDVDDGLLNWLDHFEDHPTMYRRIQIYINLTQNSDKENIEPPSMELCWCYFYQEYDDSFLEKDFWEDYDSTGSHGLSYDEREAESFL